MKRFLYLSYHFAPIGGSGTFRQHHFVRHGRAFGWEPTVIARPPNKSLPHDERLLAEIPPEVKVYRARVLEFTAPQRALWRLGLNKAAAFWVGLYFPDPAAGWIPGAYRMARKAAMETRFDAVVSVGFPFSAHLIARRIADEFGLPWLVDCKDEWSDSPYVSFSTPLHRALGERLEGAILQRADRVLAVTDAFATRLQARAGETPVHTLENGYDERLFADAAAYRPNAQFVLAYIGSYYGINSPADLFAALERLLAAGQIDREKFRFRHVGMGRYDVPATLAGLVERQGFVPQSEANRMMQTVELLTQTLPDPAPHSGKVFDYLRAGRPILAVTPAQGMLAKLLRETGGGDVVEPGDIAGMADAILRRYRAWETGGDPYTPDMSRIGRYEWGSLAERFCGHLDATVEAVATSRRAAL